MLNCERPKIFLSENRYLFHLDGVFVIMGWADIYDRKSLDGRVSHNDGSHGIGDRNIP